MTRRCSRSTLDEINAAAPDTPVFILYLYGRALLNKAALNVLGFDKTTPNPRGGVIEKTQAVIPLDYWLPNRLHLFSIRRSRGGQSCRLKIKSTRHDTIYAR